MLIVNTKGSAYDRGRQYGRHLGMHVRRRAPKQPLQPRTPASEADRLAGNMLRYLETHEPALVQEMRGMAAGAEVPFEAIFHLNVATFVRYILDFTSAPEGVPPERASAGAARQSVARADGCTNVA